MTQNLIKTDPIMRIMQKMQQRWEGDMNKEIN